MHPQVLARVGLFCLLAGIVGLALRGTVLDSSQSTLWLPLWKAGVFMLSIVGAGLLTIGMAYRDVETPAPVAQD